MMRTVRLALKSIRCKAFSFLIIFAQLSVCFAILVYTACALFMQFRVVLTANGVYRDELFLSRDYVYVDKYERELEGDPPADYLQIIMDYAGVDDLSEAELTDEERDMLWNKYWNIVEDFYDENHRPEKYMYSDLYECLEKSGYVSDTASNYSGYTDSGSGITFMDETFYNGLRLETELGVDLNDYPHRDNYFYAVMYPDAEMPLGSSSYANIMNEQAKTTYGVGDVLESTVYNMETDCEETFYFEIVDKFVSPAYAMPKDLQYSGENYNVDSLEDAFISEQSAADLTLNGSLVVLKPNDFDMSPYYTYITESYTMIKPRSDLTDEEYDDLLTIIRDCGFNVIDLNEAKDNTVSEIWSFVRENCFILLISLLMVIFSIISAAMLSGGKIRRENAVYKLCGADKRKLIAISAVKWALIFIPSCVVGAIIAVIYSKVNGISTQFIGISALVSIILFAVLYAAAFIMSYKTAVVGSASSDLSEEENYD